MRITSTIRIKIRDGLIAHRFDKEFEAISKEENALALAVYEDIYSYKIRQKMKRLPKGWLPTMGRVFVSFGGTQWLASLRLEKSALFPYEDRANVSKLYDIDDKLSKRYFTFKKKSDNYREARTRMISKLNGALAGFSSTKQLEKEWPEAMPFVPGIGAKAKTTLPAIIVKELNAELALP